MDSVFNFGRKPDPQTNPDQPLTQDVTSTQNITGTDVPPIPPSNMSDVANIPPPVPPVTIADNTSISSVVRSVIGGVLDNTEAMKLVKETIEKEVQRLKETNEVDKAAKLEKELKDQEMKMNVEKNTVYHLKINFTLFSPVMKETEKSKGIFYKNVNVDLTSHDSEKKAYFSGPSPFSYNFDDVNRFTKIDNVEIQKYLDKINVNSIINNYQNAKLFNNFNQGWNTLEKKVLEPGYTNTLVFQLNLYIKDVYIYAELPKVSFGAESNISIKEKDKYTNMNKLTKPQDMNGKVILTAKNVKPDVQNKIIAKLNQNYQHEEIAATEIKPLFSDLSEEESSEVPNITVGGGNVFYYLLKPKKMKRKTLKKMKKLSKKSLRNNKKSNKK
jgi:hypothetical protein